MSESQLSRVFLEVSRNSLEAERAVCFVLDEHLQLLYCNRAWDRFAIENDAPQLCGEQTLGTAIVDSTSGDLQEYYRSLYRKVLTDREPRGLDFHCSSADVERLMRMQIYRLRDIAALLVNCSLRLEQPHPGAPAEPLIERYRNPDGLIVMCSNCRRTRRVSLESAVWDWVPDFVRRMPKPVSHGLCKLCVGYYYPDFA